MKINKYFFHALLILNLLAITYCGKSENTLPFSSTLVLAVTSVSPTDGTSGIPTNSIISATFNVDMDSDSIQNSFSIKDSANNFIAGVISYNNKIATFDPINDLVPATTYTATITTSAKNVDGNNLANDYIWSFTTATDGSGGTDTTPPTVGPTSPVSNATEVAIDSNITATFSEDMDSSSVTIDTFTLNITGAPDSDASLGTVSYDSASKTATFDPELDLQYGTNYTATITTLVKDVSGNYLAANYTWSFTTVVLPDTTPPDTTITAKPANPTNSTSATFEFISTESGSTFLCKLDTSGYSPCTSPMPYTSLSESSHTFSVIATDSTGNADGTSASYTWTIDTTSPTISAKYPVENASDVSVTSKITVTFSEGIDPSTINIGFTLKKKNGNASVDGTITLSNNIATFEPSYYLEAIETEYIASISTAVKDLAGNGLASTETWTFKTVLYSTGEIRW